MDVVQFSGESNWDAIINHFSLDIVEEDAFRSFLEDHEVDPKKSDLDLLMIYFENWLNENPRV